MQENEKLPEGEREGCMDENMESAFSHFGKADGNVIDSLITPTVKPGMSGGFTINGMHISPHNYGKESARHRIVIDYDSEFPCMLLQIVKIDP